MKNLLFIFVIATFPLYGLSKTTQDYTKEYNVVWSTPSNNALESMPVGGGDIGLNVWVENGDILFYIGQSGTFDENNHMLKHGRVRLKLSPNPFTKYSKFRQELNLKRGDLEIKSINISNDVSIQFWVDIFKPVINITIKGKKPMNITAQFECWRNKDRVMTDTELFACYTYKNMPNASIIKSKDEITAENGTVKWSHRTNEDRLARNFCIEQQGLTEIKDKIYDPQTGRTFGGYMWGKGFKNIEKKEGKYISTQYIGYPLTTIKSTKEANLHIALTVGQFSSIKDWDNALMATVKEAKKDKKAKEKSEQWWSNLWDRSYIVIGRNSEAKDAWNVGRNYQLFRYMLACNSYGSYPSKFNGSIFTVDPELINKKYKGVDADFRQWGGGSFTAQNQRLVYWPMLKCGDFDMMHPQFNFYKDALPTAEARTEYYWGHKGASFTEQLENFGLPIGAGWGFDSGVRTRHISTERGEVSNRWIVNHYVNQLEFSLMILDYYRFSGNDIAEYLPFIKSSILFFDEHYRYEYKRFTGKELENGKLVFYPSTSAEMYKVAKNPTDVIAAMQSCVSRMATLPESYVSKHEKEYYAKLLTQIPAIPFDTKEGHKVIKPAESWLYVANQEIPELYTLFPYGIYGIGKEGLDIAKNTWNYGESHKKKYFLMSWSQVGIFAARLGLRDEASRLLIRRMKNSNRKFPAFWGPGVDWLPDFNHGGSCMIALQEMLMQTIDDSGKIYLFPAWKKSWDVKFKMHAPHQTVVEAELKGGKVVNLKVTPESRKKDVVIMLEQ